MARILWPPSKPARPKRKGIITSTLNERQEKGIARIFREGIDGFKGGLKRRELYQHHRNVSCHGDE
jgi:hypothetical protein